MSFNIFDMVINEGVVLKNNYFSISISHEDCSNAAMFIIPSQHITCFLRLYFIHISLSKKCIMNLKFGNLFLSISLIFLCLISCTKTENYNVNSNLGNDIMGEWNLVFSSSGRVLPFTYNKGEVVWTFEDTTIKKNNNIDNSFEEKPYFVLDTVINSITETQLKIDGHYVGNVISIDNDSMVINAEKHIGCGGSMLFVR
jgi:hypothetical protein